MGGRCWYRNPQLCWPGALCKLELSLKKWSDVQVSEPQGRDTIKFLNTRQQRLPGATVVPLCQGCQDRVVFIKGTLSEGFWGEAGRGASHSADTQKINQILSFHKSLAQ